MLFLVVFGCFWLFLIVFDCFWLFLVVFGCFWLFCVFTVLRIFMRILLDTTYKGGDIMEKYKTHIELCFENAEKKISKITNEIINMDGMSGVKTRHFYNNLMSLDDARYLEIGTWKGSSVCSAMCENAATIICIDNWSEFGGPKDEFVRNFAKYRGKNQAQFIEQDCFTVDVSKLPKFNVYMYDGNHDKENHSKALHHFYNCLDDVFIFIVDDWNWPKVREGTHDAIKALNLKVLYHREIFTPVSPLRPPCGHSWWNGIYVAILKKNTLFSRVLR
jgi:hypothetical protein